MAWQMLLGTGQSIIFSVELFSLTAEKVRR